MNKRNIAVALTLTLIGITAAARADAPPQPVQVVANVLSLSEDQIASWIDILRARQEAIAPLQQQLQATQQALAESLQSASPDPAATGRLLIEAHAIELQIHSAIAQANAQFELILTDDQRARLQQIRAAAQVCPIVPAFQATGLL